MCRVWDNKQQHDSLGHNAVTQGSDGRAPSQTSVARGCVCAAWCVGPAPQQQEGSQNTLAFERVNPCFHMAQLRPAATETFDFPPWPEHALNRPPFKSTGPTRARAPSTKARSQAPRSFHKHMLAQKKEVVEVWALGSLRRRNGRPRSPESRPPSLSGDPDTLSFMPRRYFAPSQQADPCPKGE